MINNWYTNYKQHGEHVDRQRDSSLDIDSSSKVNRLEDSKLVAYY